MPKNARIVFNYRYVVDCTIRDQSSSGASLQVASSLAIPDTFDLIGEGDAAHACRVVWRKPDRLDVSFEP